MYQREPQRPLYRVIRSDAPLDEVRAAPKRNAPPRARRSRVAISVLFFLLGAGGGSWAVRIPDIQHHLGLSTGALGVALLAVAVGSLLGMPIAGALAARLDAAGLAAGCAFAFAVVLALPPLATGYAGLCGVLLLLGAASGALGVMINAQAVLLERWLSRPMMSFFHGVSSLGALGGALSSIVAAAAGIPAVVQLPALTGALLALAILAAPHLVHAVPVRGTPTLGRPSRHVLALGMLAFAALLCEGAVTDWSAVFLRKEAGAGPVLSGVAYVAFAGAMAAGRLAGDRLAFAWGPRRLVVVAGACATTAPSPSSSRACLSPWAGSPSWARASRWLSRMRWLAPLANQADSLRSPSPPYPPSVMPGSFLEHRSSVRWLKPMGCALRCSSSQPVRRSSFFVPVASTAPS